MGMLDDAIREHLELKKRSGASDEEVRRLESEVFGPVRRDQPAGDTSPGPDGDEDDEPTERRDFDLPPDVEHPTPVPPPDPEADEPPPAARASRDWLEDHQDTNEFTAADAEDAEGGRPVDYVAPDEDAEDLLEETPEFLQETPEHDRLWFEQRPPRGFDFDK